MEYPFKDLTPLDEATARTGYYKDWTHIDADTFHQISELVKFIREKGYGSDTREAIAQALERVYHDAAMSGNANMEVSMARGGFDTLGGRLDETTAQLAQTVKHGENESITKKMLSQDIKEDLNNGEIEFKLNTSEIEEGAVSHTKIDKSLRENFVDPETSLLNTLQAGGTFDRPFARYHSTTVDLSNPIPCVAGGTWTVSLADPSGLVYLYNELDEPLSIITTGDSPANEPFTFTIPELEGLHHFRVNMRTSIIPIEEYLIVKGDDINLAMKANLEWLEIDSSNIGDNQVTKEKIVKSFPTNYVVPEDSEPGKLQAGAGTVGSPFVVRTTSDTTTLSNFIPCQPGEVWTLSISDVGAPVYFYDNSGNPISYLGDGVTDGSPYTFTVPNNPDVTQFRVNMRTSVVPLNKYAIVKGSSLPSFEKAKIEWLEIDNSNLSDNFEFPQQNYGVTRFKDSNILVTGDSITEKNYRASKNWHDYLKDELGFGTVINDGKSGTGLVKPFSTNPGLVDRIDNWTTDLDYILIMGAMNDGTSGEFGDATEGLAVGDFTDSPGKQSVYAAAHLMAQKIIDKYPNTPVGFITSTPRSQVGARGKCWGIDGWFEEYFEAYSKVMAHYSIPLLDLYHASGLRPWNSDNNAMYFSSDVSPLGDGIHPNALGQEIMSIPIIDFVKRHFN